MVTQVLLLAILPQSLLQCGVDAQKLGEGMRGGAARGTWGGTDPRGAQPTIVGFANV